jgi:hypothetical protein
VNPLDPVTNIRTGRKALEGDSNFVSLQVGFNHHFGEAFQ